MYAVAEFFSPEARRAAARALYFRESDTRLPRDVFGYCPLGIMAAIDRVDVGIGDPAAVELQHAWDYEHRDGWVYDPALAFVTAWDQGAITDLYEALGVEREAARG